MIITIIFNNHQIIIDFTGSTSKEETVCTVKEPGKVPSSSCKWFKHDEPKQLEHKTSASRQVII